MSNVPRRLISLLLSFAMVLSLNSPAITVFAVEEVPSDDSVVSYGADGGQTGNENDVVTYDDVSSGESDATDGVVEVEADGSDVNSSNIVDDSNSSSDIASFDQESGAVFDDSSNDAWADFASDAYSDIEAIQASDMTDKEKEEAIMEASLRLPFEEISVADPDSPDDYPEGLEPGRDYDAEDYDSSEYTLTDSDPEQENNQSASIDEDVNSTSDTEDSLLTTEATDSNDSIDTSSDSQESGIFAILKNGLDFILKSNVVGLSAEVNENEYPGGTKDVPTVGSKSKAAKMKTECGLGLRFEFCEFDHISLDGSRYTWNNQKKLDKDDPGYSEYYDLDHGAEVGWCVPSSIQTCDDAIRNKSFIDMPSAGEYYCKKNDGSYERHPVTVRMYVWNRAGETALISRSAANNNVAIRNLDQLTRNRGDRRHSFIGLCYEFKDEKTDKWLKPGEFGYTTFLDLDRESFWKNEDKGPSVSNETQKTGGWWDTHLVRSEPEAWAIWEDNIENVYGQAKRSEDPEIYAQQKYFRYYPEGFTVKERKYSTLPKNPSSGQWHDLYTFNPRGYKVYGVLDTLKAEDYTQAGNKVNMALGFKLLEDDTGNHTNRGQLRVIYNSGTLYGFTAKYDDTYISYCVNDTKSNGNNIRVYRDDKWRKSGYKKNGVYHYFKNMSSDDIAKIAGYSGSKSVLPYTQDKERDATGQIKGLRYLSFYTDLTSDTAYKMIFNPKLAEDLTGKTYRDGDGTSYEVVATGAWSVNAKKISDKSSAFDKNATMCLRPRGFLVDNETHYQYESGGSTKTGDVNVRSDAYYDYIAPKTLDGVSNSAVQTMFMGPKDSTSKLPSREFRSPMNYAGGAKLPEGGENTLEGGKDKVESGGKYRNLTLSVTYIAMSTSTEAIPIPVGGEPACGQEYTEENRATPDSAPGKHTNTLEWSSSWTDSEGHSHTSYWTTTESMTCYSDVVIDLSVIDASGMAPSAGGFTFELSGSSASGSITPRTATTNISGVARFNAVERGEYVVTLIRTPDGPASGGIPEWWNLYKNNSTWSKKVHVKGSPSHSSSSRDSQGHSCQGSDHDSGTVNVPFTAEYESTTLTVSQINIDAESPSYPVSTAKTGLGVWLHGKSSSGKDISVRKVVDSSGVVTFPNIPVNDAVDVNGDDMDSYIVEFYETNQRPKSMFTSDSWENSAQEVTLEFDRNTCVNTPADTRLTLVPIEADFAVWTKTSGGKQKRVNGVVYDFIDVYGFTSNLGIGWNYTSSTGVRDYAPGPHIGRGAVRIISVPETYMVPPSGPTMVEIEDRGGIQHFDIYLAVTEVQIDAIDTATEEIMDRKVLVSLIDDQGRVAYTGRYLSMYQDEVPPGTYTIRVDSVPQSQTDANGRSVHYDYPATNSRFLEFEVSRVGGVQPHEIYIDHLGSVSVQKFDEDGGLLPGTTFKLTGRDRDGNVSEERVTNADGKVVFNTTNQDSSGTLVGGQNAKLKTGSHMPESRALIPGGVDHITYTLVETKAAPASGLALLPDQIDVTLPMVYTDAQVAATQGTDNPIDTSKGWHNDFEDKWYFFDVNYRIYNGTVFAPPATGGEGNKLLGLAGVGVAGIAAGAWLLLSKRKEHAE